MIANGQSKNLNTNNPSTSMKSEEEPEPIVYGKLNWLIHLQHMRDEIDACKELIKWEIETSNGCNDYAFYKQGIILREEGKLQEALDSFQICLKLNPQEVDYTKEVARCFYEMRRYKLSMEAYLEAERISNFPDWQIYFYLGQCFIKLGDMNKAKEYAHKSVEIGKNESCYSLLMKILISEGDLKSAIAVSTTAIESCPDSVDMLTESGLLFLKMGQSEHAFERLSSAVALEPTCTKALLGIGCITQKHGEYDVAMSKYKIAIQYDPDSVALWNNMGMCYYSKQKYIAAISCLKRALWISPLNWKTLFNLGLVHLATSQPASAFNFVCAAVNLRPDVADCFAVLGLFIPLVSNETRNSRYCDDIYTTCFDQVFPVTNSSNSNSVPIDTENESPNTQFVAVLSESTSINPYCANDEEIADLNYASAVGHSGMNSNSCNEESNSRLQNYTDIRNNGFGCSGSRFTALMELKDPENAARAMRQALAILPDDPVFVVNAALCCQAAGQSNEASDLLQRLSKLIDDGVPCSEEVTKLAEQVVAALKENRENNVEKDNETSHVDPLAKENYKGNSQDKTNETDESGMLYAEFPSGQITESGLEPDEV